MPNSKPTKDDVVALEKSYWDAMKSKHGARSAELSGKTTLVTGAQGVTSIAKAKMGKRKATGHSSPTRWTTSTSPRLRPTLPSSPTWSPKM